MDSEFLQQKLSRVEISQAVESRKNKLSDSILKLYEEQKGLDVTRSLRIPSNSPPHQQRPKTL